MKMENVFTLDIGTRVVIGLIIHKCKNGYEIVASSRTEHSQRAMYDGQVHDVDEVARAVRRVKEELEFKTGKKLAKVAVAAAGRALETETATASREEPFPVIWEKQEFASLEMEALFCAMNKISSGADTGLFHCVGYSTVKQKLEDLPISSLVGQRGRKAELTVIATFLPRTVVDGLIAVLGRVGLQLESLTLEPIAAGQAAVPADMRRHNLALIDIGAGTSDIALTKEGTFFAYGMVPVAGDEITEVICSHYFLDFQEGEKLKKNIADHNEIEMVNFFGEKTVVSKDEILEVIRPAVHTIAEKISQEISILNNNNKPQAVILVGGGSLTPMMADILAQTMDLPRSRTGIQVRERLQSVYGEESNLTGSDVITSIGIGINALEGQGLHYYSVIVNEAKVPILDLKQASVAEALLAAGIQPGSITGRPGNALVYEFNGKLRVIKGNPGNPARITVNGQPTTIDQKISPGDVITFIRGYLGSDAQARIRDVFSLEPDRKIIWNGAEEEIHSEILLNGQKVMKEDSLKDGCKLVIKEYKTLYDLIKRKGLALGSLHKITIKINGVSKELGSNLEIRINRKIVHGDCIVRNNDNIEITEKIIRIGDLGIVADPMIFTVNDKEFLLPPLRQRIFCKGKELLPDSPVQPNMELRVEGFTLKPILSDILPWLNLTDEVMPGAKLNMLVNGNKAEFTTSLNQGDRINIAWINSETG